MYFDIFPLFCFFVDVFLDVFPLVLASFKQQCCMWVDSKKWCWSFKNVDCLCRSTFSHRYVYDTDNRFYFAFMIEQKTYSSTEIALYIFLEKQVGQINQVSLNYLAAIISVISFHNDSRLLFVFLQTYLMKIYY